MAANEIYLSVKAQMALYKVKSATLFVSDLEDFDANLVDLALTLALDWSNTFWSSDKKA